MTDAELLYRQSFCLCKASQKDYTLLANKTSVLAELGLLWIHYPDAFFHIWKIVLNSENFFFKGSNSEANGNELLEGREKNMPYLRLL